MGHKAGRDFFEFKRPWSVRKDRLLTEYLPPYLEKVSHAVGKPIVLVDGFAGKGKFDDGSDGSPLILYKMMRRRRNQAVSSRLLLIEQDPILCDHLKELFNDKTDVEIINGCFMDQVVRIADIARSSTVFIYIDPFAVREYQLTGMRKVFELVKQDNSIEILLNLNILAFVRLVRKWSKASDTAEKSRDEQLISGCAGGDWWKAACKGRTTSEMADSVRNGFVTVLGKYFDEVCVHDVMARSKHAFPKYTMVFASRSSKALDLMNDAMALSARGLVSEEAVVDAPLFASVSPDYTDGLSDAIVSVVIPRASRKKVRQRILRKSIGKYLCKEINSCISDLIRQGQLHSSSGRSRINDDIEIW